MSARRLAAGLAIAVVAASTLARPASAASPAAPTIIEPVHDGQLVHPGDVHMEVTGYSDADGDPHLATDWQIVEAATGELAWRAPLATGLDAVHIHLGDGEFLGGNAHRLEYATDYVLRARFRDGSGAADQLGAWSERRFTTHAGGPEGGPVAWTPRQPGFVVDSVAGDLRLPVDVAFVPNPGPGPRDPLLYVSELYGAIKVITRDGTVHTFASGLLNFNPTGNFPGSGELGLTGIAVEPTSGDLFAARLLDDGTEAHDLFPQVIRLHSEDGGLTASGPPEDVLTMYGDPQGPSHQISDISLGPDGKLYVHNGDGLVSANALDLDSFLGKVLRMNPDGSAPADNPFYEASEITARDYVWAYGFRNPFGGDWRASTGAHYAVGNGLFVDRLVRVDPGGNYGWDGTDASMSIGALYNWQPSHAPVSLAFVQPETQGGSGFPAAKMDHAFVTESGPTYTAGPKLYGKRVVEFPPKPGGELGGHPTTLVEYTGTGLATAVGLAAGPDGLYFTDLYKDQAPSFPSERGARLWRISFAGTRPLCTVLGTTLTVRIARGRRARIARLPGGAIAVSGRRCGATVRRIDRVLVLGARGNERVILDLRRGPLAPGPTPEPAGASELELSVLLGRGAGDALTVLGRPRADRLWLGTGGMRLNRDADRDVVVRGVERFRLVGRGGPDRLHGGPRASVLVGGPGRDRLTGGRGRDLLLGRGGADLLNGGPGIDRCDVHRRDRQVGCERPPQRGRR